MYEGEHQLGDFIKGRLLFIEKWCKENKLDYNKTLEKIREEVDKLVKDEKKKEILEQKFFKGTILPTSHLPDWFDKIILEAMTYVLKGKKSPLYTKTSAISCIPFEAGRFNAQRQAETVFKALFAGKTPVEWLKTTFKALYRQCYGDEAGSGLILEEIDKYHYKLTLDHKHLEKASPLDCSTIIGYIYGALEKLGAKDIKIIHEFCSTFENSPYEKCIFEIFWNED